ncbi:MAG: VCBS repeat-containing protein [Planctomycetaceae bacterium]|nr:VCBS repeat-containing protein [Planctomycetales bacterium]MCB9927269.1 VCBS repeat-containing protein [Planctomycetaceae bacterium]
MKHRVFLSRVTLSLLLLATVLPIGIYRGFSLEQSPTIPVLGLPFRQDFPESQRRFAKGRIGPAPRYPGIITHVQVLDFNRDGRSDVIVCDAQRGRVLWYSQSEQDQWEEVVLNRDRLLAAPARATIVDLDGDGDRDVLVAVLGSYMPSDEHVGKAVWLENNGENVFTTRVLLEDVGRVTDVETGDFDADGDLDLVVAVFGHYRGKVVWLENDGHQRYQEHELLALAGAIHVPTGDYDGDGDVDIAALFSQDEESVIAFENTGTAEFAPRRRKLFQSSNFDLGTAGLIPCDLDANGKTDFLLVAGDNLDLHVNHPQPWHGCIWLENLGEWNFEPRRLASFGGSYSAAVGDIDADGDLDVALVSMFNKWDRGDAVSIVWLENNGLQEFKTWRIDSSPIELATVACGDLNGDGCADIVAGSFHVVLPFDHIGRITTWTPELPP